MMLISQGRSSGYLTDKSEGTGYASGTKNPVGKPQKQWRPRVTCTGSVERMGRLADDAPERTGEMRLIAHAAGQGNLT